MTVATRKESFDSSNYNSSYFPSKTKSSGDNLFTLKKTLVSMSPFMARCQNNGQFNVNVQETLDSVSQLRWMFAKSQVDDRFQNIEYRLMVT